MSRVDGSVCRFLLADAQSSEASLNPNSINRHASLCQLNQILVQLSDGMYYTLPPPSVQANGEIVHGDNVTTAAHLLSSRQALLSPGAVVAAAAVQLPARLRTEQQQLYR